MSIIHDPLSINKTGKLFYCIIIAFAVVCFLFFQLLYPYHFYFKGQNQLFLMSWSYVSTFFAKPAWAACLAGEFLTQFYYYDFAGAIILTLSLTLLFWLAYQALSPLSSLLSILGKRGGRSKIFQFSIIHYPLILIIVVREASCHLFYAYTLSSTFALIGGLLMFLLVRRLMTLQAISSLSSPLSKNFPLSIIHYPLLLIVATLLCYWMFGYGVWVFLILCVLSTLEKRGEKSKNHPFSIINYPLIIIIVFACLLPFMRSRYNLTFAGLCQYPGVESLHAPDFNRETDLHMIHSYETGDWDDVVETAQADPVLNTFRVGAGSSMTLSQDAQVSSAVRRFIYNLVQAQRGKLPDVLLQYYPNYLGTFTSMIGTNIPMMMFMNLHEYYYAIGDISRAERGAFMSCVSVSGNRNAYDIKRLAECALVRNDQKAADKFLGLLRQTIPYKEWADSVSQLSILHSPLSIYYKKAQFINLQDTISPSEDSYNIMTQLLKSNPENEVALDYLLCSLLLKKDVDCFKRDYDQYCTDRPRIRKLYQEALCIWLMKNNASQEEWQKYIKDEQVMGRLKEYMAEKGSPRFADTYWFYFDVFNLN